jgi:hypothetical protein
VQYLTINEPLIIKAMDVIFLCGQNTYSNCQFRGVSWGGQDLFDSKIVLSAFLFIDLASIIVGCSKNILYVSPSHYTDKKENKIFLIYREIQSGAVAKSYMRKGFLIYEEMRKYFHIYEQVVSHIWLGNCSTLNFLIYEENLIFFFISVLTPDRSMWLTRREYGAAPGRNLNL